MDKNKIKSYAVWARRAMIEAVKDRAFKVGIEENKIHDIERLQGGFKVVASGDIVIEGVVEDATVISDGQIIVKHGIHGMNKGVLRAKGNIICKFIF